MEIATPDPAAVAALWAPCAAANGLGDEPDVVLAFGDSAELADELVALVESGRKRATAASVAELREAGVVVRVGAHGVVHDGAGRPRCVLRTTDVRTGPLSSVDDRFARDDGEGDRTREWWLQAHRRSFNRAFARHGWPLVLDPLLVFERFTVVWPPSLADAPGG